MSIKVIHLFTIAESIEKDIQAMREILQSIPSHAEHFVRIQKSISDEIAKLEQEKQDLLSLEFELPETTSDIQPSVPIYQNNDVQPENIADFRREKQVSQQIHDADANSGKPKKIQKRAYRY
ncbi:MAG: hypothetical protein AAF518_07370 [Spirochaetota bacterium]